MRIPMSWFCAVVNELRRKLGPRRVLVFSDGTTEELKPLLTLPMTERRTFGSALADLIALSRARVLVAPGSTFSMWGAFLGSVPTIWLRGQRPQRLLDDERLEPEVDASGAVPDTFVHAAQAASHAVVD